jgi:hypothetical protein
MSHWNKDFSGWSYVNHRGPVCSLACKLNHCDALASLRDSWLSTNHKIWSLEDRCSIVQEDCWWELPSAWFQVKTCRTLCLAGIKESLTKQEGFQNNSVGVGIERTAGVLLSNLNWLCQIPKLNRVGKNRTKLSADASSEHQVSSLCSQKREEEGEDLWP